MYRPTMSVRAMLGVVAFFAVASVALVRASDMWASLMFTAALGVISFAVLAAILRRGAKQAFWIGFALFGWLYLWMAHWRGDPEVPFGPNPVSWRLQNDETGTLATTQFLVYVYNHWLPTVRKPPEPPAALTTATRRRTSAGYGTSSRGGYGSTGYGGARAGYGGVAAPYGAPAGPAISATAAPAPAIDYPAQHEFTRVGHSLFIIIQAFIGGITATYLYTTRDKSCSLIQTQKELPKPLSGQLQPFS